MRYRLLKEQVDELRAAKGWTQYELAAKLDITDGRLSYVINSERTATPEFIQRIAEVFKVEPTHFDLYILRKLPSLAASAPALIDIGRKLLDAKDNKAFMRIASKIDL